MSLEQNILLFLPLSPQPADVNLRAMSAALDAAMAPFGSEVGLLEDGLGLTPARLTAFRGVLLA